MGRFDCIICFCVTGNTERNFRGCIIRCVPNEWLQNYSKNNVYRSNRGRSGGIESLYLLHFHNCCNHQFSTYAIYRNDEVGYAYFLGVGVLKAIYGKFSRYSDFLNK